MKKVIPILLVVLTLTSCSTVLLTGRRQLNLVSDAELNQMSFAAYKELKDSVPLSADKVNSAMVNRVGDNLKKYWLQTVLKAKFKISNGNITCLRSTR